ncbi:hypothetical protein PV11_06080 [Exophiala sideris]|uniref:PH domain-containing protein n=1 Tax=Exophiala sideris TaxID=1016849 RepID=A0A0D1YMK4_9EURO|nr:hypothetical protein PV11_06080 [Exophiala sideris]
MSTTSSQYPQLLPSPKLDEQSGWWPSDRSTKSRFKAFFSRTKSQDKVPRYVAETFPSHPSVQPLEQQGSTTSLGKRSRSTTWSKGSRTSKQQRPRNVISSDPPPLFHAYTQAKLHAILDIPCTFTEALLRSGHVRRNSISSETPSRSSLENLISPSAAEALGISHKRNWSSSSVCSLSQKLFILTTSGYVLQYSADGQNDRLPEKILELGADSVAFASDAIPGKHWVLQISHDGHSEHMASQHNKSGWTKWSFKSADNKKVMNDLLLVFDDAKSLRDWLAAVRKEIEHLGGSEYRSESHDEPKIEASHSLKAQRSLPSMSQSSPHLPMAPSFNDEPASPTLLPPLPRWNTTRNISRSTTESSIQTLNDLDQLRNPSFSDDRSDSTAQTSFTDSFNESFSSIDTHDAPPMPSYPHSRLSTPTQEDTGELSMYMATPKKTALPRRTTSLEQREEADVISHDLFVQPTTSVELGVPHNSRPISTVAPLPEPGHIRKISARHRYDLQVLTTQPNTPTSSRPSSIRSRSSSYTSYTQDSSPDGQRRTPSYSLFPKTPSTEQSQIQLSGALPSPPATTPGAAYESMCNQLTYSFPSSSEDDKDDIKPRRSSSRSTTRRNRKMVSIDLKTTELVDQPQRSPAVTEGHLETCFGTQPHPSGRKRAPSATKDMIGTITTTTLEPSPKLGGPVPKLDKAPSRKRHVKGQKSLPALLAHRSATPTMPMPLPAAPIGPPPSGPLPALPTEESSCLPPIKKSTGYKPRPPPKHAKAESSDAVYTLKKMGVAAPILHELPPPAVPPKSAKRLEEIAAAKNAQTQAQVQQQELVRAVTTLAASSTTTIVPAAAAPGNTSTETTANNVAHHTRNLSSISSVGSVRHVTAWLASPRVAVFSANYESDDDNKENRIQADGLGLSAPKLNVPVLDSPAFSKGFEALMS